tara:strand:+ start:16385 stop:17473 length:1089 start_codon:yes stop_codon:yes gene_type:complete
VENQKQPANIVLSQRSRKLPSKKYSAGDTLEFDIPSGEVIKEIVVSMHGKVTPSYSAGNFVFHKYGVMDALVRALNVNDGSKVLKGFQGVDVLRRQARYLSGSACPTFYKKNSSTLGTSPSVGFVDEAGAFGANSGNDIAFSETVSIPFENKLSNQWSRTLLNTKGKNNVKVEMVLNELSKLVDASDGTTVVTGVTSDITIEVQLITIPAKREMPVFENWRQSHQTFNIFGQQSEQPYKLTKGARVQGFWITAYMGSANRRLSLDEAKELVIEVRLNGTELVKKFSLYNLMMENLSKSQISEVQDGSAYCNFLDNSMFETALNTSNQAGVLEYDAIITTPSSWSYSSPVQLTFEQDDIELKN